MGSVFLEGTAGQHLYAAVGTYLGAPSAAHAIPFYYGMTLAFLSDYRAEVAHIGAYIAAGAFGVMDHRMPAQSLVSLQRARRAAVRALHAAHAAVIIYLGQVVLQRNRAEVAYLHALAAGNASRNAILAHGLCPLACGAHAMHRQFSGHEAYHRAGAVFHAHAAAGTFFLIDAGKTDLDELVKVFNEKCDKKDRIRGYELSLKKKNEKLLG